MGVDRIERNVAIQTQTSIEAIVAMGYGLSEQDLRFMLSADPEDRRGSGGIMMLSQEAGRSPNRPRFGSQLDPMPEVIVTGESMAG